MKWSAHIALVAIVGCVVEQNIDGDATQIMPAVEWEDGLATIIQVPEARQSADEATQAAERRIANKAIAVRRVMETESWALLRPSKKNDPVFRKARADACELYNTAYRIPKEDTGKVASIFSLAIPYEIPKEFHMEAEALYNIGTSTENMNAAAKPGKDSKPIIAVKEARVIPVRKALDEKGKIARKGDAADSNGENIACMVDGEIKREAVSRKVGATLKVETILEEEGDKLAMVRGRTDGEGQTQVEGATNGKGGTNVIEDLTNFGGANTAKEADTVGSTTNGEGLPKIEYASTANMDTVVEDLSQEIIFEETRVVPVTDEEGKMARKGDAADDNGENFDCTVDDEIALEAVSRKDGTALKVEAILKEEGGKVDMVRGRNDCEGLTQVEGPIKVMTNPKRANSAEGADKIGSLTSGEVASKLKIADQGGNNSEGPTMFEGATDVRKDITESANIVECVDKVGSETDEKDLSQSQGLINVDDLNAIEGITTIMIGRVTKGDDLTKVERANNGEGATTVVKEVTNSEGAKNAKSADKVGSTTDRQKLPKVKCTKSATKGKGVINVKGAGKTKDQENYNLDSREEMGGSEVGMEAITKTGSANEDNGVAEKVTAQKATDKQTGAKVAKLYRQGMGGEVGSPRGHVDRASKVNVSGNTEPVMVTGLVNDHTASDNCVTGKGAAEKATSNKNHADRPPLYLESAAKHNNPAVAVIILTFAVAVAFC